MITHRVRRITARLSLIAAVSGAMLATGATGASAGEPTKAAGGNPPCYSSGGDLYCGNDAPVSIRARASYGTSSNPVRAVDKLKSNPSYFECWVHGQRHSGGNDIWYRTYGDVTGRWGYVAAAHVWTWKDPFPGVTHC